MSERPGATEISAVKRVGNIYRKITTDGSSKLGTVLIISAVIASAFVMIYILHAETDDSSAEITDNGQCGPNAYYYFYSDGTLKIDGVGEMYNYSGLTRAPWNDYGGDVHKIVICDQITRLGEWAFISCTNAKELTMPITLNASPSDTLPVFKGCCSFEKINFTYGKDGYGCNYAAYQGSNAWYNYTPWYQSRDCLKEINFADGIIHIGNDAFRELNITYVVLPDSVTSLGWHTFFNCTKLAYLTIPISLNPYDSADYPAFQGCTAVKEVIFTKGNGVPFDYYDIWKGKKNTDLAPWNINSSVGKKIVISNDITYLGDFMFAGCNIKELVIPISFRMECRNYFSGVPDTLEKLTLTKGTGVGTDYSDRFARDYLPWTWASELKSVIIEDGVTHLGNYTFFRAKIDSLILPDSMNSIGERTFSRGVVRNLTIPISLNAVCYDNCSAFSDTTGLTSVTFTPGSGYGVNYAVSKGSNCLYYLTPWYACRGTLEEIVFKDGIKSLGSDAFRELNITSIVIPDTVESLGCHTFYQCINLTDLTIPITLDSICSDKYPAFDQCHSVTNLRFTAGTDGVGFDYNSCAPFWCHPLYKPSKITIDGGITYLGKQTFAGYSFIGMNSDCIDPIAENLSGHVFEKRDGLMYLIE